MSKGPSFVDKIYHGDSRNMEQVPDGVVSLVVCSPPYNVKKPYTNHNDDMELPEYKEMLREVWLECKRVLRPGGRLCVNVAGVWRQPYLPLHAIIWQQLIDDLGFEMRGEIIWDKGASVGVSTAWGSFASPSNPTLRDVHEYILVAERKNGSRKAEGTIGVFSKDGFALPNESGADADIRNEEFVKWTRSIWDMPTESSSRVGHPAPFPVELPRRLIRLYTYLEDIVLDPFAGVGSTCVAAYQTGRHFIGYDIDEGYVRLAKRRVSRAKVRVVQLELSGTQTDRRGSKMLTTKLIQKTEGSTRVGNEVRPREVRVSVQDGAVLLGIKTLGKPDIQKQNMAASLPAENAHRLAISLLSAAEDGRARRSFSIKATALVGQGELRDREVKVSNQEGEVLLGIRSLKLPDNPDIQKQHITASLAATSARSVAIALLKAIESLSAKKRS